MFISIIIPAFNEEKRLERTIKRAVSYLNENFSNYELIVVNDGSEDSTAKVAKDLSRSFSRIQVINYEKNHGKGFAVKNGMLAAKGNYVFFMDADNSTPIEEMSGFIRKLDKGVDVVIGSRHISGSDIKVEQPLYRRFLGRFANQLIQLFILPGIYDSQCGFKGFTKKAVLALFDKQTINGWGFDFEILALAKEFNFSIAEVPVRWLDSRGSRVRPIRGALKTLAELIKVKYRLVCNKYRV